MVENLSFIGDLVVSLILGFAGMLVADHVPGLISFGLCVMGAVVFIALSYVAQQQITATRTLQSAVESSHGEREFSQSFAALSSALERQRSNGPSTRLSQVWADFRRNLIEPADPENDIIQSTTPAWSIFNVSMLGFGLSGWRFWPGLFVSVGLFLTFLGLVAALQQTGAVLFETIDVVAGLSMANALTDFLQVASSKFIMSLTGLFVSILLTVAIRVQDRRINVAIRGLALAIDRRVKFVTLEHIAQEQLEEAIQAKEQLSAQNATLIENLRQPLQEATKLNSVAAADAMQHISTQISNSMQDVFSKINVEVSQSMREISQSTFNLNAGARRAEMASSQLELAASSMAHQSVPQRDTGFRQRATDPPSETLDGSPAEGRGRINPTGVETGPNGPLSDGWDPKSVDRMARDATVSSTETALTAQPIAKLPRDAIGRLQSAIEDVRDDDEDERSSDGTTDENDRPKS